MSLKFQAVISTSKIPTPCLEEPCTDDDANPFEPPKSGAASIAPFTFTSEWKVVRHNFRHGLVIVKGTESRRLM
jgi:hypothetical protein